MQSCRLRDGEVIQRRQCAQEDRRSLGGAAPEGFLEEVAPKLRFETNRNLQGDAEGARTWAERVRGVRRWRPHCARAWHLAGA